MIMNKYEKNGLSGISKSLIDSILTSSAPQKKKPSVEIICDGDSWVFGCEIVNPKLVKKHDSDTHAGAYDFEEANDAYRRPKIFSTHLSKLLNAQVTNLSWPADDNGSILRRTMDYISNKYLANNLSTDNLFVMIGWSSPERNSFWYKDDKLSHSFRLWPQVQHFDAPAQEKFWQLYVTYLWNPEEYMTRYVHNVVQFQNFCKTHNIKWMCWNSFYQTPAKGVHDWHDLDIREELEKLTNRVGGYQYQTTNDTSKRFSAHVNHLALWDTIDPVRFYKKDQPKSTFKSYIDDPANNVKDAYCGWHPSPTGHEAWAHELARYIKENKLL